MLCLCGSQQEYQACCKNVIEGVNQADSAEALMRSRYVAYALGNAKYLLDTTVPENRYEDDVALIKEFAQTAEWVALEVLKSKESGSRAVVEFKAYYLEKGQLKLHHEKSDFRQEEGVWFYEKGALYDTKIGRNESCACGSGKKYKHCHAARA